MAIPSAHPGEGNAMRDRNGEELLIGYIVVFWRDGMPHLGTVVGERPPDSCAVLLGVRDPDTLLEPDAEDEARELRRLARRGPGFAAERLARDLMPETIEVPCDKLEWLPTT